MEIICAGYPKTSSKSCSNCLRTLGFKVADYVETVEFLSDVWVEYVNGRCSIRKVIAEYNKHGFHANQDIPGNMYWEELFHASPNAKVILTVRDNTDVWNRSMISFMRKESSRLGNPGSWLFNRFTGLGWTSPKMLKMQELIRDTKRFFFGRFHAEVGWFPSDWRVFTWQRNHELMLPRWRAMQDKYEAQIRRVKQVVPQERLLVWNIKEGWQPLCKFLGKPVPDTPIPHDNRTGDEYLKKYFLESDVGKEMVSYMKWHVAKFLFKTALVTGAVIFEKKNDFRITKALFSATKAKLQI